MRYDVFISYSSIDQKIAEGVCAYLEQQGIRCFVAYRDIHHTADWARVIVEALEQSRMMVVLFSQNFNDSPQVDREIAIASHSNIPILTFRLSNDEFYGAKKYYLQNLNWIDAFPQPERYFGKLYEDVKSLLGENEIKDVKENTRPQSTVTRHSKHYLWFSIVCVFMVVALIFVGPCSVFKDDTKIEQAETNYNHGLKEFDSGNYYEAVKWFRESAKQGHAGAQFHLGNCYQHGTGVSKDSLEAIKWFRKSAEQGDNFAQAYLGKCYYFDGRDASKAVKWFCKSAEQGNAEAQFFLGTCYFEGTGVSKDPLEAIKWLKESAEQGYAGAQTILGVIFFNGDVVQKDISKAVKWLKKAAGQGEAEAQYSLGVCYENGEGVPKDMSEAVKWYKSAAEQGHSEAQCNLGVCYENGEGVPKDMFEAVIWYKKSAANGDACAQYNLGHCYEYGYGISKDYSEAVIWYKKAANQGLEEAKEALKRFEDKILGPVRELTNE